MKVKLLQDVIIAHGPTRLFRDDIVDLPSGVAQPLISSGQAIEYEPVEQTKAEQPKKKTSAPRKKSITPKKKESTK